MGKNGKDMVYALRDVLRINSGFQSAADRTFQVAGSIVGSGSKEQLAVKKKLDRSRDHPRVRK